VGHGLYHGVCGPYLGIWIPEVNLPFLPSVYTADINPTGTTLAHQLLSLIQ
jgi:hypothetical protein